MGELTENAERIACVSEQPVPENRTRFSSGAIRSADANSTRYDLMNCVAMRRIAEAYAEGAKKYDAHNWRKGFPVSDVMNHALRHIFLWLDGDASEDHLGHAAWNLCTAMYFEERMPEMMDIPDRTGGVNARHDIRQSVSLAVPPSVKDAQKQEVQD